MRTVPVYRHNAPTRRACDAHLRRTRLASQFLSDDTAHVRRLKSAFPSVPCKAADQISSYAYKRHRTRREAAALSLVATQRTATYSPKDRHEYQPAWRISRDRLIPSRNPVNTSSDYRTRPIPSAFRILVPVIWDSDALRASFKVVD
jgi:hypothetical protein